MEHVRLVNGHVVNFSPVNELIPEEVDPDFSSLISVLVDFVNEPS